MAGAVLGALAVALGAFGAHGLKERLAVDRLEIFEVGVRYQMYHALALLLVATMLRTTPEAAQRPTLCFVVGTIIFSGSLYAMTLTDVRALGMVTPLGGLGFLAGWVLLFVDGRPRTAPPPNRSE